MESINVEMVEDNLSLNVQTYVETIINKYGMHIPKQRLDELKGITDFKKVVKVYETGSINAYASQDLISMPLCADRLLQMASKVPGYGINKNHKSYNDDTLISNNNTFVNYIFHTFIAGENAEGYYNDMLLHEVMHFCGSGGATALKEGINELLTRKIALENNFRTNGCGYPKEVKMALKLQNVFGEDILNQIAFINSDREIFEYLNTVLGRDAAFLYLSVSTGMEKEFNSKYYSDIDNYSGIGGIIKKTMNYNKINYSEVEKIVELYQSELLNNEESKKR